MKRRNLIIAILLACAACQAGATVATVNGERITARDLAEKMRMERGLYDPAILSDKENFATFRRQALESLITETVLLQEAKRQGLRGVHPTRAEAHDGQPGLSDEATLTAMGIDPGRWREAQRRRALIRELIVREVMDNIPVSDEQISDYYRKHIADYRENARFHARQILVDKKETADRVRAELMKGADFGELAKQYSVSPDAERGGDLGFFDAETYPETFAEICGKLKPGEISEVVATPYGYQIFQLIASRPPRQRSLAEVQESIRRKLQEQDVDERFKPWLDALMQKAHVAIEEKALGEVKFNG